MEWSVVMARFREVLVPNGYLAIVGRVEQENPWWPELLETIKVYSTNRDYQPYNLIDELEARGLFEQNAHEGLVHFSVAASVAWGAPAP